ncbi:unnamed protein product [Mytilus coruscus]|uniref:Ubiquitin-like protease family profile domain-containing protein n=1 Tax=Mytilus coruscus TaxID=42192 RepID=A0A6J8CPQ4_MYTCO|nr:unnamed protein product [Mytilus coruscus]
MNNITRKNRKPISIDRILNMGKYMSTQTGLLYRLTGVVIHHGTSPRNGHYTYVKTDGGPQIQINDCSFKVYDDANLLKDSYLLQYEQFRMMKPYATITFQMNSYFKYASEAVHILLVERHGTVCQINVGQVYEAIRNTNECVMFLEKKNTKQSGYEAEASKFALVKEQYISPVSVGSLHLSKEEVNRFLLDDFSDLNIDAYLETLKSKSENNMFLPAVWYNATFSSTFVRKPNTSKAWLNNDLIFVPANVDSNHWVLIVFKPKERYIYYLDPLGKDPNHDVMDRLCKFLNNQILLEHFESHLTVWKVENLINNGIFPSQTDSTSCGPLICLYVKMILEDRRLMEYHVSPVQIRQYIFKEVIKVYKNDLNTEFLFGLKNSIKLLRIWMQLSPILLWENTYVTICITTF